MVSYDKTQILNDMFDIHISTGTIANHAAEFAEKAETITQEIPLRLQDAAVLHFDENSGRADAKNHLGTYSLK
jgi:hypothetical protein